MTTQKLDPFHRLALLLLVEIGATLHGKFGGKFRALIHRIAYDGTLDTEDIRQCRQHLSPYQTRNDIDKALGHQDL